MIKIEAMKWLIENVTKWPLYEHGITSAPNGWRWCKTMLGMELVKNEPTTLYADMHIQQQEWLNGEDEPRSINIEFTARCNRKKPVYYIAGPMTGYDNFNRSSFNTAAKTLSMNGHVLNPAMLPDGLSNREYMSICLPMVQCATHVHMLKGWEKSPGALTEHGLAVKIGLVISYE